jgi:hypothetical protein
MRTSRQQLEAELRQLQPPKPSDRLRASISGQLETQSLSSQRRWTRSKKVWAVFVLASAACVAVAVLRWPRSDGIPGPLPSQSIAQRSQVELTETPPPTMLAYQRMLGQSADELDRLLDEHAGTLLGSSPSIDSASRYLEWMPN